MMLVLNALLYCLHQLSSEREGLKQQVSVRDEEIRHVSEHLLTAKQDLEQTTARVKELQMELDSTGYKNRYECVLSPWSCQTNQWYVRCIWIDSNHTTEYYAASAHQFHRTLIL